MDEQRARRRRSDDSVDTLELEAELGRSGEALWALESQRHAHEGRAAEAEGHSARLLAEIGALRARVERNAAAAAASRATADSLRHKEELQRRRGQSLVHRIANRRRSPWDPLLSPFLRQVLSDPCLSTADVIRASLVCSAWWSAAEDTLAARAAVLARVDPFVGPWAARQGLTPASLFRVWGGVEDRWSRHRPTSTQTLTGVAGVGVGAGAGAAGAGSAPSSPAAIGLSRLLRKPCVSLQGSTLLSYSSTPWASHFKVWALGVGEAGRKHGAGVLANASATPGDVGTTHPPALAAVCVRTIASEGSPVTCCMMVPPSFRGASNVGAAGGSKDPSRGGGGGTAGGMGVAPGAGLPKGEDIAPGPHASLPPGELLKFFSYERGDLVQGARGSGGLDVPLGGSGQHHRSGELQPPSKRARVAARESEGGDTNYHSYNVGYDAMDVSNTGYNGGLRSHSHSGQSLSSWRSLSSGLDGSDASAAGVAGGMDTSTSTGAREPPPGQVSARGGYHGGGSGPIGADRGDGGGLFSPPSPAVSSGQGLPSGGPGGGSASGGMSSRTPAQEVEAGNSECGDGSRGTRPSQGGGSHEFDGHRGVGGATNSGGNGPFGLFADDPLCDPAGVLLGAGGRVDGGVGGISGCWHKWAGVPCTGCGGGSIPSPGGVPPGNNKGDAANCVAGGAIWGGFLSGHLDGCVRLWEVSTGAVVRVYSPNALSDGVSTQSNGLAHAGSRHPGGGGGGVGGERGIGVGCTAMNKNARGVVAAAAAATMAMQNDNPAAVAAAAVNVNGTGNGAGFGGSSNTVDAEPVYEVAVGVCGALILIYAATPSGVLVWDMRGGGLVFRLTHPAMAAAREGDTDVRGGVDGMEGKGVGVMEKDSMADRAGGDMGGGGVGGGGVGGGRGRAGFQGSVFGGWAGGRGKGREWVVLGKGGVTTGGPGGGARGIPGGRVKPSGAVKNLPHAGGCGGATHAISLAVDNGRVAFANWDRSASIMFADLKSGRVRPRLQVVTLPPPPMVHGKGGSKVAGGEGQDVMGGGKVGGNPNNHALAGLDGAGGDMRLFPLSAKSDTQRVSLAGEHTGIRTLPPVAAGITPASCPDAAGDLARVPTSSLPAAALLGGAGPSGCAAPSVGPDVPVVAEPPGRVQPGTSRPRHLSFHEVRSVETSASRGSGSSGGGASGCGCRKSSHDAAVASSVDAVFGGDGVGRHRTHTSCVAHGSALLATPPVDRDEAQGGAPLLGHVAAGTRGADPWHWGEGEGIPLTGVTGGVFHGGGCETARAVVSASRDRPGETTGSGVHAFELGGGTGRFGGCGDSDGDGVVGGSTARRRGGNRSRLGGDDDAVGGGDGGGLGGGRMAIDGVVLGGENAVARSQPPVRLDAGCLGFFGGDLAAVTRTCHHPSRPLVELHLHVWPVTYEGPDEGGAGDSTTGVRPVGGEGVHGGGAIAGGATRKRRGIADGGNACGQRVEEVTNGRNEREEPRSRAKGERGTDAARGARRQRMDSANPGQDDPLVTGDRKRVWRDPATGNRDSGMGRGDTLRGVEGEDDVEMDSRAARARPRRDSANQRWPLGLTGGHVGANALSRIDPDNMRSKGCRSTRLGVVRCAHPHAPAVVSFSSHGVLVCVAHEPDEASSGPAGAMGAARFGSAGAAAGATMSGAAAAVLNVTTASGEASGGAGRDSVGGPATTGNGIARACEAALAGDGTTALPTGHVGEPGGSRAPATAVGTLSTATGQGRGNMTATGAAASVAGLLPTGTSSFLATVARASPTTQVAPGSHSGFGSLFRSHRPTLPVYAAGAPRSVAFLAWGQGQRSGGVGPSMGGQEVAQSPSRSSSAVLLDASEASSTPRGDFLSRGSGGASATTTLSVGELSLSLSLSGGVLSPSQLMLPPGVPGAGVDGDGNSDGGNSCAIQVMGMLPDRSTFCLPRGAWKGPGGPAICCPGPCALGASWRYQCMVWDNGHLELDDGRRQDGARAQAPQGKPLAVVGRCGTAGRWRQGHRGIQGF
eukprot:jgi/Mesvir1/4322/Mv16256-RA.1